MHTDVLVRCTGAHRHRHTDTDTQTQTQTHTFSLSLVLFRYCRTLPGFIVSYEGYMCRVCAKAHEECGCLRACVDLNVFDFVVYSL